MKLNRYLLIAAVAVLATILSACGAAVSAAPAQTTDAQSAPVVEVSLQTNTQPQPVSDAPAQGGRGGGERDLTAAAEALGVTVEELQQALQAARPAECTTDATTKPADGVDCRADLNAVAEALGVTVEELQSALGSGRDGGRGGERDLTAAAETLGVTVEELEQAMQDARPTECADDATTQPADGVDCRADLEAVAETLGVTVEDLQSALGNRGERDLTTASETLGVTEEELQQALDAAKPADCDMTDQGNKGGCRPDLTSAAETLGVTVEDLQSALGKPPHDGQGGQGQPPAGAPGNNTQP